MTANRRRESSAASSRRGTIRTLRELTAHVRSHLFFTHRRAAIGSAVQQTNCHPFRHGRWLFMHNGFAAIKRDLVLAVDESLCPEIKGQTDTEALFYLALTFGLENDPPDAVARAIGFVEDRGERRGVKYPFQGTIATTDGERLWAFRYSSEGKSRSLFLSEPIGDLPGAWNEVPEGSYGVVGKGDDQLRPFKPKPSTKATAVTA